MQLGMVVGGPWTHMRHLINRVGATGLLKLGMLPTILRDFICMGTFFTTTSEFSRAIAVRYLKLIAYKNKIFDVSGYPNSPVSHVAALLGGAMAGVAGWALCYPFDVWKSNVQQHLDPRSASANMHERPLSFFAFFNERCVIFLKTNNLELIVHCRYNARGIRGLYSGLGPTLFRAIPVNATKFFAFDLVIRIFHMSSEM